MNSKDESEGPDDATGRDDEHADERTDEEHSEEHQAHADAHDTVERPDRSTGDVTARGDRHPTPEPAPEKRRGLRRTSKNDGATRQARSDDEKKSRLARLGATVFETPSRDGSVEKVSYKDLVRWKLARHLIWLLWTVVTLVFVLVGTAKWTDVAFEDVRSVFELMFTALVALVGSAVGFYFGSESSNDRAGDRDD